MQTTDAGAVAEGHDRSGNAGARKTNEPSFQPLPTLRDKFKRFALQNSGNKSAKTPMQPVLWHGSLSYCTNPYHHAAGIYPCTLQQMRSCSGDAGQQPGSTDHISLHTFRYTVGNSELMASDLQWNASRLFIGSGQELNVLQIYVHHLKSLFRKQRSRSGWLIQGPPATYYPDPRRAIHANTRIRS